MRRKIKDQLGYYRRREGLFGFGDSQVDRFKVGSATWWEDYGGDTPELQFLAIRLLSQGCSSSPVECMWSCFGHIVSKKRLRLGAEKANDLVFVNANLHLLNKVAGGPMLEEYMGWDHDLDEETLTSGSYSDDSCELGDAP